jgi:hypothetical protein
MSTKSRFLSDSIDKITFIRFYRQNHVLQSYIISTTSRFSIDSDLNIFGRNKWSFTCTVGLHFAVVQRRWSSFAVSVSACILARTWRARVRTASNTQPRSSKTSSKCFVVVDILYYIILKCFPYLRSTILRISMDCAT